MGKFIELFKQWDKVVHAAVSCVVMLFVTAAGTVWFNYWAAFGLGTIVTIFCAFVKEFVDKIGDGCPSWKDIIACAIGWVLTAIPLIVIGICK